MDALTRADESDSFRDLTAADIGAAQRAVCSRAFPHFRIPIGFSVSSEVECPHVETGVGQIVHP